METGEYPESSGPARLEQALANDKENLSLKRRICRTKMWTHPDLYTLIMLSFQHLES